MRPYHLGPLLGQGIRNLAVFAPRVVLLAVGDEIGANPSRHPPRVGDTITPVLRALLPSSTVRVHRGVPDDARRLAGLLRSLARRSDLIVTVGGSSVGPHDTTKRAVRSAGTLLFEGVRVGVLKRAAVGRIGRTPVVVLPGQVGSAVVAWHEHGLHVIARCVGAEQRTWESVRLARPLVSERRMDSVYLLSVRGGRAVALPWGVRRASQFLTANAFAVIGRGARLPAGARIRAQRLDAAPVAPRRS